MPPRPLRFGRVEILLVGTGVSLAIAASGFAAYMISDTTRVPTIYGAEHLMIFARPSTPEDDRGHSLRIGKSLAHGGEVDETPVGSIGERPRGPEVRPGFGPAQSTAAAPATGALPTRRLPGLMVRGIFNGKALIETPGGLVMIGPGSTLPHVGAVIAIEPRDGKWVVITDSGIIGTERTN